MKTRSTFKILFYLKRKSLKRDGSAPIMCRITVDGTISQFSCKSSVDSELWDTKAGRVSGKSSTAKEVNFNLDKIRVGVNKHYGEILEKEHYVTAEKVKNAYLGLGIKHETLLKIFAHHNEEFARQVGKTKSKGTYKKYCLVYNHLQEFIKCHYRLSDIALKDITPSFIKDFDLFLRTERRCANNTVWLYTIPLKRVVTIAQNQGLLHRNPFFEYRAKREMADRGYLTKDEIKILMNAVFTNKKNHELVRDLFIFCCFTGLAFVDLKNLTKDNLQTSFDGHLWIITKRQKTHTQSNIRLLDIPKKILQKYEGISTERLLPVPCINTLNGIIKRVTKKCGIDKHVTWHMARHTYATEICLTNGVPIETVSKMLGHTNIRTTQIYAKITNEKVSRDMEALSAKLEGIEQFTF